MYRVMKDLGRGIGHDVLVVTNRGLVFYPPGDVYLTHGEIIFEASATVCRALVEAFRKYDPRLTEATCYAVKVKGSKTK